MPTVGPLTQVQKAQRRRKIADAVAALLAKNADPAQSIQRVANKYNVSFGLVRQSCQQHGVTIPRLRSSPASPTIMSLKTLRIVRELMAQPAERGSRKDAEIAREYDVSREWVGAIKRQALEAGVLKPKVKPPA